MVGGRSCGFAVFMVAGEFGSAADFRVFGICWFGWVAAYCLLALSSARVRNWWLVWVARLLIDLVWCMVVVCVIGLGALGWSCLVIRFDSGDFGCGGF